MNLALDSPPKRPAPFKKVMIWLKQSRSLASLYVVAKGKMS